MKCVFAVWCRDDYDYTDYVWKLFSTRDKAETFITEWRKKNPSGSEPLPNSTIYNRYGLFIHEFNLDETED